MVDVNRSSNGSHATVLEITVSGLGGVLIVMSGRLNTVLHVRRLVVRERHYGCTTTGTGAANGNDRV